MTVGSWANPFDDQLNLVHRQRGRQRLPVLDHVGCLAGSWEIDRDRPAVTHPRRALDQAQRLVLADQLRVSAAARAGQRCCPDLGR
jgi:hypothetical protein